MQNAFTHEDSKRSTEQNFETEYIEIINYYALKKNFGLEAEFFYCPTIGCCTFAYFAGENICTSNKNTKVLAHSRKIK